MLTHIIMKHLALTALKKELSASPEKSLPVDQSFISPLLFKSFSGLLQALNLLRALLKMGSLEEKYGGRLRLTVCYCSSEDDVYHVSNLQTQVPSSSGWQSSKNCEYPQELGFHFEGQVSLNVIRFLSHERKISSLVDVYVADADEEQLEKGVCVPYEEATFTRLGHVRFSMNEENNFAARELKTIGIRKSCIYIKFLFNRPHDNTYNIFQQVGLIGIAAHGVLSRTATLWSKQRLSVPVASVIEIPLEEMVPFYKGNEDTFRPLSADKFSDPATMDRLRELYHLKQKAIAEQDYDLASALKGQIDLVRTAGKEIDELEVKKLEAVQEENYAEAKTIKKRIDELRNASYFLSTTEPSSTETDSATSRNPKQRKTVVVHSETAHDVTKVTGTGTYDEEAHKDGGIVDTSVQRTDAVLIPLKGNGEPWEIKLNTIIFEHYGKKGHPERLEKAAAGEGKFYEDDLGVYAVASLLSSKGLLRSAAISALLSRDGMTALQEHTDSWGQTILTYLVSEKHGVNDQVLAAALKTCECLEDLFRSNIPGASISRLGPSVNKFLTDAVIRLGDKKEQLRNAVKGAILALSRTSFGADKVANALMLDSANPAEKTTESEESTSKTSEQPKKGPKKPTDSPAEFHISRMELLDSFVDSYGVTDDSPVPAHLLLERVLIPLLSHPKKDVRDGSIRLIVKLLRLDYARCSTFLPSISPAQRTVIEAELQKSGAAVPAPSPDMDAESASVPRRASRSASQEAASKSGTPRLFTSSKQAQQGRRSSRRLSQSSGVLPPTPRPVVADGLVSSRTCHFCREFNENFTEANLDIHYIRSCPMLCPCPLCDQVTEIATLQHHLVTECDGRELVRECPRCREAVRAEDLEQHVDAQACIEHVPTHSVCPLCHGRFRSGMEGWRKHLTTAPGCVKAKDVLCNIKSVRMRRLGTYDLWVLYFIPAINIYSLIAINAFLMGFFSDSPPPEIVGGIQQAVKSAFSGTNAQSDAAAMKLIDYCSKGYSEAVMEELRPHFKYCPEKTQLRFISIVDLLLLSVGSRFSVAISTEKWTERFFRVAKTSTTTVRDTILKTVHQWSKQFPNMGFRRLLERFRNSKVLGEPYKKLLRDEKKEERDAARASNQDFNHQVDATRNQILNDEETFLLQAQGDLASLEYIIEMPQILPDDDVARECKHHKKQCMRMLESGQHQAIEGELINLIERLSEALDFYEGVTGTDMGEGTASRARAVADEDFEDPDSDDDAYQARLRQRGVQRLDTGAVVLQAQQQTQEIVDNERKEAKELRTKLEELQRKHEELQLKYKEAKEKNKAAVAKMMEMDQQLQAGGGAGAAVPVVAPVPIPAGKSKASAADIEKMSATAARMRGDLLAIRQGLREIKTQHSADIVKEAKYYAAQIANAMAAMAQAGDADRQADRRALQWTQELYKKEMQLRKQYYNQIQELKGNIRVYCRVRPMLPFEIQAGHTDVMSYPTSGEIKFIDAAGRPKTFEFDEVYQPSASQAKVFEDTSPLIDSDNEGINTRALERLFNIISSRKDTETSTVSISVLEIYCEQIRDLLAKSGSTASYEVKQGGPFGTYITNLTEVPVANASQITEIMAKAQSNRSQGKTNMNEHSSRSHMILYIIVRTTNTQTGLQSYGKLSLIDLAGSERLDKSGAVGQQQKEAVAINKSLSSLGDVISGLSQSSKHIPFRNSVLTFLLQDSMAGQAKVLMFVCVSPASYNVSETTSSLLFASRARGQIRKTQRESGKLDDKIPDRSRRTIYTFPLLEDRFLFFLLFFIPTPGSRVIAFIHTESNARNKQNKKTYTCRMKESPQEGDHFLVCDSSHRLLGFPIFGVVLAYQKDFLQRWISLRCNIFIHQIISHFIYLFILCRLVVRVVCLAAAFVWTTLQEMYRNLSEQIQQVSGELGAQQKQNFFLMPMCQSMLDEALSVQRSYYEVLAEVQDIRNAIRSADIKLSHVARRIHEFDPIDSLVIHSDGYTYTRGNVPEPAGHGQDEKDAEPLPNLTLVMLLEKLSLLFPQSERSIPYTHLTDDGYNYPNNAMLRRYDASNQLYNSYSNGSSAMLSGVPVGPHQSGARDTHRDTSVAGAGSAERFHPCIRVYGMCNYGKSCAYARYPYEACLSNLKGRCRFGNQCHERHRIIMALVLGLPSSGNDEIIKPCIIMLNGILCEPRTTEGLLTADISQPNRTQNGSFQMIIEPALLWEREFSKKKNKFLCRLARMLMLESRELLVFISTSREMVLLLVWQSASHSVFFSFFLFFFFSFCYPEEPLSTGHRLSPVSRIEPDSLALAVVSPLSNRFFSGFARRSIMNHSLGHQDLLQDDEFQVEAPRMIGDEISLFYDSFSTYLAQSQRLAESSSGFIHFLQHTRVSYNNAVKERDMLYEQLKSKIEKLQKCESTLQRYECANDPVVASDGYTYERGEIEEYIEECKSTQRPAFSFQTKEELTDRIVSNRSLVTLTKELVDMIKPETNVLPEYKPRGHIESYAVISNPPRSSWEESSKPVMANQGGTGRPRGGSTSGQSFQDVRGPNAPRRFDNGPKHSGGNSAGTAAGEGGKPELHPCLRIYRCCNFKADCTFASYPYEACLNHIKGKCRFGAQCKELHVDRDDPRYINPRSASTQQAQQTKAESKQNGSDTSGSPEFFLKRKRVFNYLWDTHEEIVDLVSSEMQQPIEESGFSDNNNSLFSLITHINNEIIFLPRLNVSFVLVFSLSKLRTLRLYYSSSTGAPAAHHVACFSYLFLIRPIRGHGWELALCNGSPLNNYVTHSPAKAMISEVTAARVCRVSSNSCPSLSLVLMVSTNGSWIDGFFSSFSMILVSEIGDKTFFIAALMAMQNSRLAVYVGAIGALAIMTILSAMLGLVLPSLFSVWLTNLFSAFLLFFFGFKMLHEVYSGGEPNEEMAEAAETLRQRELPAPHGMTRKKCSWQHLLRCGVTPVVVEAFTLTFLAEWGDRSQMATIVLAAAGNPYAVTLGGIVGHACCSGAAVIGGGIVAQWLSPRTRGTQYNNIQHASPCHYAHILLYGVNHINELEEVGMHSFLSTPKQTDRETSSVISAFFPLYSLIFSGLNYFETFGAFPSFPSIATVILRNNAVIRIFF
eukprot:gene4136-2978_t